MSLNLGERVIPPSVDECSRLRFTVAVCCQLVASTISENYQEFQCNANLNFIIVNSKIPLSDNRINLTEHSRVMVLTFFGGCSGWWSLGNAFFGSRNFIISEWIFANMDLKVNTFEKHSSIG